MRHKGSYSDIGAMCARKLYMTYKKAVAEVFYTKNKRLVFEELVDKAVNTPTERFYVSESRAYQVVIKVLAGKKVLNDMTPQRREMFEEIIYRVRVEQLRSPYETLLDIVARVIEQPAPKFYLTHGSAKVIIRKEIKKERERKRNAKKH